MKGGKKVLKRKDKIKEKQKRNKKRTKYEGERNRSSCLRKWKKERKTKDRIKKM